MIWTDEARARASLEFSALIAEGLGWEGVAEDWEDPAEVFSAGAAAAPAAAGPLPGEPGRAAALAAFLAITGNS